MSNSLVKLSLCVLALLIFTKNVSAQTENNLVNLPGSVPPALADAVYIGHHDPTAMLHVLISLKLRNTSQLHAFLKNVQDKNSPSYHQFLTPQQFTADYGPTADQVNAVANT